jgi:tetratricopeptide (TPR) repeat protein
VYEGVLLAGPGDGHGVRDGAAAKAWLDAERLNLVAAIAHAADHGWPAHTGDLATILRRYLYMCGHYADAFAIHTYAHRVAREHHDRPGEAAALHDLGWVRQAWEHHGEAIELYQHALAIHRQVRDYRVEEARTLDNLGLVYARLGRYDDALDCLQRSFAIVREIGARDTEAVVLSNLGEVCWRSGRTDEALVHLRQALAITHETVTLHGCECDMLYYLGVVYGRLNRHDDALDHLRQALTVAREHGEARLEVQALNGLGETQLARGQPDAALAQHQHALTLARQLGVREEQARAHAGAAYALHVTG